jgi:hypothetical protein
LARMVISISWFWLTDKAMYYMYQKRTKETYDVVQYIVEHLCLLVRFQSDAKQYNILSSREHMCRNRQRKSNFLQKFGPHIYCHNRFHT